MTPTRRRRATDQVIDQMQRDQDRMKDQIERLFVGRSVLLSALWRYIDAQDRGRFRRQSPEEEAALNELRRLVGEHRPPTE